MEATRDDIEGLFELQRIDLEIKRLSKELEKKKKYLGGIEKKLSNEKFLAKAPEDVIQRERDNMAKAQKEIQQLESSLADLGREKFCVPDGI